jgi:hypothetical protein
LFNLLLLRGLLLLEQLRPGAIALKRRLKRVDHVHLVIDGH